MTHFADDPQFSPRLRVIQIIAIGLMAGVLTFLTVILALPAGQAGQGGDFFNMLSVLFMAVCLPVSFLAPRYMARLAVTQVSRDPQLRRASDDESVRLAEAFALMARYQASVVISYAFLEGPAFFGLFAYMQFQELPGLIVAGVCVAGMVLQFPTRYKVVRWVENRQLELEDLRRQS